MAKGISGKDGQVKLDGVVANQLSEWNLNELQEFADTTSFGSGGRREKTETLGDANGSLVAETFLNKIGASSVILQVDATTITSSKPRFSGQIIITSRGTAVPVGDKVGWSYDFENSGALLVELS